MNSLLTVTEVAKLLSCSPSTVYSWAETGRIPSRKINGLRRFDPEEIKEFVEDSKDPLNAIPKIRIKPAGNIRQLDHIIKKAIASSRKDHYNSPKGETSTKSSLTERRK